MATRLKVGVIFGGRSGEHEISLLSARTVMESLDPSKYEVVPIGITKQGNWLLDGDPMSALTGGATPPAGGTSLARPELAQTLVPTDSNSLARPSLDVVIPVLHGTYGEDGTVQGLLELAQIPYVGAGVLASAVGMDKAIMKDVFRQHGIPVVESLSFLHKHWRQRSAALHDQIDRSIGYPCFVKPANLGSSVGIVKVRASIELPSALDEAGQYDRKIVVERAVQSCREIEVAVLGNDDPTASIPGEIIPCNEFYDYAAKYLQEGSQLVIPAQLPAAMTNEVRRLAVEAFRAVDGSGLARVDCFVSGASGDIFVNEVNTMPGFTSISMYPKLWEASGIGIPQLLDRLIALALERHEEKQALRTSYRQD